jgi:hypothetical protein
MCRFFILLFLLFELYITKVNSIITQIHILRTATGYNVTCCGRDVNSGAI